MEENLPLKETIIGARNLTNILLSFILLAVGIGFSLAGLSSYFQSNYLKIIRG